MWGFFLFCFLILPSIINHISWDIFFHSNMWYALLGRHFILNRKKYTAYKYLCCSRKSENKLALKKKKRVKCEEQGEFTKFDYKEFACPSRRCKKHKFDPWIGKILWSRKWQITAVFLPGKSHGQRNLMGYIPWCCKRVRQDLVIKQQTVTTTQSF